MLKSELQSLQSDFAQVTGVPFKYFYCPMLFRDEDVELCKGHIVNEAFANSERHWIVQRKDIDNFYGSAFEADFVDIQFAGSIDPVDCILDKTLSQRFRPSVLVRGQPVPHYNAGARDGSPNHPIMRVEGERRRVRLGLKVNPDALNGPGLSGVEIRVERDLRLAALASLLKAAHLSLFRLLGYRFVLSAGGRFMGWDILGTFFDRNRELSKPEKTLNARTHFREFANLVRPVVSHNPPLAGTITDKLLYVCELTTGTPWAFIVFVRTGQWVHAVFAPIFEQPDCIQRFVSFLRQQHEQRIRARLCQFVDGVEFRGWPNETTLTWPAPDFEA